MSKFLNNPIRTIFLMLGSKCNFKCKYCMQCGTEGITEPLPEKINPEIFEFIKEVAERQFPQTLGLHFYGGEPLIYFNSIKEIVNKTKKIPNIRYSIITNGRLIDEEKAEYFNKNNINVCVSWDGKASNITRGFDVFSDLQNKNAIFKIKSISISAVYSSYVYPLELFKDFSELSFEYSKIHNYHMGFNVDELFDTGLQDRSLFNIDYNRIYNEINDIFLRYCTDDPEQTNIAEKYYIKGLIESIKSYIKSSENGFEFNFLTSCGSGITTLNLDMNGNLYNCHNSSVIIGNIKDEYFKYISNLIKNDNTKDFYQTCKDCKVISICRGGCKLMPKKVREESYCKLKRAVFSPIIDNLLKNG